MKINGQERPEPNATLGDMMRILAERQEEHRVAKEDLEKADRAERAARNSLDKAQEDFDQRIEAIKDKAPARGPLAAAEDQAAGGGGVIAVGDTLYWFNENRRKYDKPGFGGKVIYSEHFSPEIITGETDRTWLVGDPRFRQRNVNKNTLRGRAEGRWPGAQYYTAEGRDDKTWVDSHRHAIRDLVNQASADQLKRIAEIVGYVP